MLWMSKRQEERSSPPFSHSYRNHIYFGCLNCIVSPLPSYLSTHTDRASARAHVCTYTRACTHTHTHTHTSSRTYARTHTYIHIYNPVSSKVFYNGDENEMNRGEGMSESSPSVGASSGTTRAHLYPYTTVKQKIAFSTK